MQQTLRKVFPLLAVIALTACDTANDSGSADSNRVRLDVRNAEAQFGDYLVHVSAQLTSDLTPEVAQSFGIVRSDTRGFVNLVVLQKDSAGVDQPVAANVTLSAANLNGQMKDASVREIKSESSVYYIAEVDVTDREVINFDFDIRPLDSSRLLQLRYTFEFYAR
jgi:hypothetical protein